MAWLKPVSLCYWSDHVKVVPSYSSSFVWQLPFEVLFVISAMPSSSNSAVDVQESGFDTCAICLHDVGEDEAFLDNCYHRFHWQVSLPCAADGQQAANFRTYRSYPAVCVILD